MPQSNNEIIKICYDNFLSFFFQNYMSKLFIVFSYFLLYLSNFCWWYLSNFIFREIMLMYLFIFYYPLSLTMWTPLFYSSKYKMQYDKIWFYLLHIDQGLRIKQNKSFVNLTTNNVLKTVSRAKLWIFYVSFFNILLTNKLFFVVNITMVKPSCNVWKFYRSLSMIKWYHRKQNFNKKKIIIFSARWTFAVNIYILLGLNFHINNFVQPPWNIKKHYKKIACVDKNFVFIIFRYITDSGFNVLPDRED